VRTAIGSIVQFLYGEDGMDGTRIEGQGLDHLNMDVSQQSIVLWPHKILLSTCRDSLNLWSCT
jgi:hypothetical protein